MRFFSRTAASLLLMAAAVMPCVSQAQTFSANYELTRPVQAAGADADLLPRGGSLAFGAVRVAPAFGGTAPGAGLSLEAGQEWFGRLTVGRSLESDQVILGGGYRWRNGQSVSMQFTHSRGERLGLAVRYDWPRYYVRLGFDPRPGDGSLDMLRFSAGMRF